ncbi:uncharacterized protein LOC116292825 [Actinia tenebrosa]|uniref:Uncharacterized protein LOC116292825 n=1 Tax=Actinia tenebrosa TaxID=6105 RepID=A0A6P8HTV0_ACTTE|nr:uncharacterized protein LOC116292825 [Actinia tenebrosa]
MEKYLVLLCLLLAVGSAQQENKAYKIALEFLMRFHSKTVLALVANSTAHEPTRSKQAIQQNGKREYDGFNERMNDDDGNADNSLNINSQIYTTTVYNIPVDRFIKEAMMAILGENGVLEKGGFYMDGYIKNDGTAFIKMVRSFGNRTNLINAIKKASQEPPGSSPLNVVVHFLLTAEDTNNLIAWQEAQIQKGNVKQDDPCAPKLIVMYKCCTRTVIPFIGPEFGSLMIGTD